MNSKLYKLIFCHRLGCFVAVGEFTRSYGKSFSSTGEKLIKEHYTRILTPLAIMMGLALGTSPLLVFARSSLPIDGQVVVGQGELGINNATLTVTQQSDKLAINWRSFDIAQGNSVIYNQPSVQSIALNRVLGRNASQIYGNLKANGQVFLLNPNGILFGKGAEVNVGGLVATTKSMSDHDFINGRYTLISRKQEGSVINQANLRTTSGGYIALVGQRVDNQSSGIIHTPQGRTLFAAGQRVTLNLDHGQLLGVQIQSEQITALLQNGGLIQADEGVIQLTAHGKDMLMNTVINNTGILQANGISGKNGVIHLDSGGVGVTKQHGRVDVSHPQGRGGEVILQGENIHLVTGSKIEARGRDGGGKVWVGGGWQGKNKNIRNAHSVVMDKGAKIDVSATNKGHGGVAVLWSDHYTGFYGDIYARGGGESGNGGQVETSSVRNLQAFGQVDAAAIYGRSGTWLLDPAEVNIVGSGAESGVLIQAGNIPVGHVTNAQIFIPTTNVAQIANSSINAQLNSGTNVTITTSNGRSLSCRWCNITLQADINKISGTDATLTLHADGNIVANNNITASAGKLNVNLLAGNTTVDSVITLNNSSVLLNGGDLLAKHANENNTARISVIGGRYDVGNLTFDGNTGVASQVGVNISNAANITVAGETRIAGESSNSNGQGWRSVEISGNSTIIGKGDIIFAITSNSKTAWMASFSNTTITSDKNIIFQANGTTWGGLAFNSSKLTSLLGNVSINLNGSIMTASNKGVDFNSGSLVSGQYVNIESHITGADGFLLANSRIIATAGDINANSTTTNKGIWISGNSSLNANGNIALQGITTGLLAGTEGIKIGGDSTDYANITASGNISMNGNDSGKSAGMSVIVDYANIESINGDYHLNIAGEKTSNITNTNITANNIEITSDPVDLGGIVLSGVNVTSTVDDIHINTTAKNKSIWIKANSSLNSNRDIILNGEANSTGEGIVIQGASDTSRNMIKAQRDITLKANNSNVSVQSSSMNLDNVSLVSGTGNIAINGSGLGSVHFSNIDLTAIAGNVTVYAETVSALTSALSSTLSMAGNNTIKAQNGSVIGSALNTSQGAGIGFRENNSLSIEGIITFQGKTEGIGATRKGIYFYGPNTLNIAKGSQLSLVGENNGAQDTAGGNGITHSGPIKLTINNNGSLKMEGSSTRGSGIHFPRDNNTVVLNGEGDTLIRGSSVAGHGVAISGVVNNSTGPVTIEGTSVDGIGVHLFSPEHQVSRINITGNSTHAEGLIISGNATITDATLSGGSISHSGVRIDSPPGSNVITRTVLDNAALNGVSRHGKGVEITSEVKGIHQSTINGTVNGIGYGIDIAENVNVTGTSQVDLLTLTGEATTGAGTGIKLNGNNDLSNTSLNGSAVEGIALDVDGSLTSRGNTGLSGTASGTGIGVQINGSLNNHVVNGTSVSGIGVHINGSLGDSRINGVSTSGSGVKIDGDTVLNNVALVGGSIDGKGVEMAGNIVGRQSSVVQGNTVNGTGVMVSNKVTLTGSRVDDLLAVAGNATGDKGSGVQLRGNNALDNISLHGNATDGSGVDISGPLVNTGNTAIDGKTNHGDGIQLDGAVSGGVVIGTSDTGVGVIVEGDTTLNNVALNGRSTDGKGVEIVANLAGSNGSTVQGNTSNGSGVDIGKDAILTGGGANDQLAVTGNAIGGKGTGVQLGGNNTLDNTFLNGNSVDGHGVAITGAVTNKGNATITGNAANKGHGVDVDGSLTGGIISGISGNNYGVFLDDDAELRDLAVIGSGKPLIYITSPGLIHDNVTFNGKPVDNTHLGGNITRSGANVKTTKPKPKRKPKPDLVSGRNTLRIAGEITLPSRREEPELLLVEHGQILSSLEHQPFPPSIVSEPERDIVANTSIAICIPSDASLQQEVCDKHIFGRWKPQH
ncbi:adhesin [Yersinia frederiksenii]|nr:adhesin [Yersinia frederiksenii]